jgi:hypothetical protein
MPQIADPFDLTLLWPIRLRVSGGGKGKTAREEARAAFAKSGSWIAVNDLVRRGESRDEDGFSYAELAYFHPFVREFLYGKGAVGEGGRHVFDVHELPATSASSLEITEPGSESTFAIRRILLYVFDGDIGILTLQLQATRPVELETALNVISYLRTAYFQDYRPVVNKADSGPGIVWKGGGGIELVRIRPLQAAPPEPPNDRLEEMREAIGSGKPAIYAHWHPLLKPLTDWGIEIDPLGDHRMGVMVFLGMEDLSSLSEDQWFALAQADGGNFPRYAPAFRSKELAASVYDRWWDPSAHDPDALKHRYLAGPMTYCCVLKTPHEHIERIRTTWRRQHYQMFLLAHYQRAALLVLQHRVSSAAARLQGKRQRDLLREIQEIQGEMAVFSSRQWFTEISPQIQGRELYSLIARQLELEALYDGVIHDKALLGNWAEARQGQRREEWRDRINRFVIPFALAAAVLNGHVFVELLKNWVGLCPVLSPFSVDAITWLIVLLAILVPWWLLLYFGSRRGGDQP